jgi:hypothetical protein
MASLPARRPSHHPDPTPEEQIAADRAEYEAHAASVRGRLEHLEALLAALNAERANLLALLGEETVDLGASLLAGPDESGVDLTEDAARYIDPPF